MSADKGTLESRWITTTDGLTMYTRLSREPIAAPTSAIVLVHGLSVSSGYMVPTAVRLAPSYCVWVPDLPGFGRSARPDHILTIPELADALAAWMQAVRLPSATLLGNSLGCQIIVNLAVRYPERIEHAILVSPTMDPKARTIHQEAGRLLRDYLVAGIPRTIGTLRSAFEDPMEEHLPQVHVPTLVVRGARDPIVPQEWVEKVHRLVPKSQLVVVPQAGHAVNFNSPEKLVRIIRSFLHDRSHC